MEFLHRAKSRAGSVALLPGAWNPPTRAHIAMLQAAQAWAANGVLVLPRALPHKKFVGVSFDQRAQWIAAIAAALGLSAAISDGGLFVDMASECRAATGADEVYVVCGRDAAERIVGWDYGAGPSIAEQLGVYRMLVAPRGGEYEPPAQFAARVHRLALGDDWHDVSSTEVRQRIASGGEWASLVPEVVAEDVWAAYSESLT